MSVIRNHPAALSALIKSLNYLNNILAKIEGLPLYRVLAQRYNGGHFDSEIYVYAAGGYYYPGKEIDGLLEEMRRYLDLGYSTVKIKIGGAPLVLRRLAPSSVRRSIAED